MRDYTKSYLFIMQTPHKYELTDISLAVFVLRTTKIFQCSVRERVCEGCHMIHSDDSK